jgi:hypothetical protein
MTTTFARKIAAVAAIAVTVSLTFAPTAQAGGFSVGFSNGEAGLSISMGGGMMKPRGELEFAHEPEFYEGGFKALDEEDAHVHVTITAKGHNVLLQQRHDCLMVKKIKLLIEQMKDTKIGYLRIGDTDGADRQQDLINDWKGRLDEAKAECNKVWM